MSHLLARLGVVVPVWNGAELLERALTALAPAAAAGGTRRRRRRRLDGRSRRAARARFPFVRLVTHAARRGPVACWSAGLEKLVDREFVLLLDSDAEAPVESVLVLARFLALRPEYAGAAARLVSPCGRTERSCQRLPRVMTPLLMATRLGELQAGARELARFHELGFDHECDADVEQPPFTALMLRRDALDAIGGLDPRFHVDFADVDLARRFANKGLRLRFLADARVVHHGGATVRRLSERARAWHLDRLRYFRKHHGPFAAAFLKGCSAWSLLDATPRGPHAEARSFRQRARELAELVRS
jgi:GT2 family glycosyltransferase